MKVKVNDKVKVIGQDIVGNVLAVHSDTNEVVIEDHDSEYKTPDNQLVYRCEDLEEEDDDK